VRTVEGVLIERLEDILQGPVRLSVAGRTDARVHARGQVASFVTGSRVTPERVQKALNAAFSPEIVVREASYERESFDARFSASGREYRYAIRTAPVADPFSGRFEWHRPGSLSVGAMRLGARALVGEHDFSSFCRQPGSGRSTVRRLERATLRREGELVIFGFRADSFLHQMVRAMVGTLVMVGDGRLAPEEVASLLAAKNRAGTGNLAPAWGLTLERVIYGKRDRPPQL
jgi:tRNA pseudouridine38-40 synthase